MCAVLLIEVWRVKFGLSVRNYIVVQVYLDNSLHCLSRGRLCKTDVKSQNGIW